MKLMCANNEVNIEMSPAEFTMILGSAGLLSEFQQNGITEDILQKCTYIFVEMVLVSVAKMDPRPDVTFLLKGNVMNTIKVSGESIHMTIYPPKDKKQDAVDTMKQAEGLMPNNPSLGADSPAMQLKCFIDHALPFMIAGMQAGIMQYDLEAMQSVVFESSCFECALSTFKDEASATGFKEWVAAKITELAAEEPRVGIFYEMKSLDHIMEVMHQVKYGHVVKRNGKYYLVSNHDRLLFCDYGTFVIPFVYSDDAILCGIRDGQFCKVDESKDFFDPAFFSWECAAEAPDDEDWFDEDWFDYDPDDDLDDED